MYKEVMDGTPRKRRTGNCGRWDIEDVTGIAAGGGSAWGERATGQMCYVCRKDGEPFLEDSEPLAKQFPHEDLPVCGKEPPAKKLCPPLYQKGCYTETKGEKVLTKMCSGVEIADCQEANEVNYCYCKGHLCNNEEEGMPGDRLTSSTTPETDDEDLSGEGGSGDGATTARTPPPTTTRPSRTEANSRAPPARLPFALVLLALALRLCL